MFNIFQLCLYSIYYILDFDLIIVFRESEEIFYKEKQVEEEEEDEGEA